MSIGALGVADGDVNQADGLGFRGAGGAGDAGDSQAQGRAGARADAVGEGFGDFSGDGAVLRDEFGGHAGERSLELVGIDNHTAEKRARCAGNAR